MPVGPYDCHVSRSGYTGEDGYEISVRGDDAVELARLLTPIRPCSPSVSARATACGSKPASASTATTSTRRRVPSRQPSSGPCRSAAATRADFPAPHASRRSWPTARRACASASSPTAARRPAKAPRSSRRDWRQDRHRHVRRLRPDRQRPHRHGLCRRRPRRARHTGPADRARQAAARRPSSTCRSSRIATPARA